MKIYIPYKDTLFNVVCASRLAIWLTSASGAVMCSVLVRKMWDI